MRSSCSLKAISGLTNHPPCMVISNKISGISNGISRIQIKPKMLLFT